MDSNVDPNGARHLYLPALLLLLLLLAGVGIYIGSTAVEHGGGTTLPRSSPAHAPAEGGEGGRQPLAAAEPRSLRTSSVAALPGLLVVVRDASTRQPVAGSELLREPSEPGATSEAAHAIGEEAGVGRIRVALPQPGRRVVVTAPGYVPQRLDLAARGEVYVDLEPRHDLTVRCVYRRALQPDRPVPDCIVVVTRDADGAASTPPPPDRPEFFTTDERPYWWGATDADGTARIDWMPRGTYRVSIFHDDLCAEDEIGLGGQSVSVPGGEITVVMAQLIGAAVALPGSAVAAELGPLCWQVHGREKRAASVHVARARTTLLQRLTPVAPGCEVFVRVAEYPGIRLPFSVECASTDLSRKWTLESGFVPIGEITAPELLEEVAGEASGRLRVVVRSRGRDVAGMPLEWSERLEGRGRGRRFASLSGETVTLPVGRYTISTGEQLPWLEDGSDRVDVEVRRDQEREAVIELPFAVFPFDLRLDLPGAAQIPGGFSGVTYRSAAFPRVTTGKSWPAESRVLRLWLPAGKASIEVRSTGYLPSRREVLADAGAGADGATPLVFRLRAKPE